MHSDKVVDGSPSVSDVYLMPDTAFLRFILPDTVSGAFLQRRKRPHIVMVASPALAAGLKPPFSIFGPLLVLSMGQTRAQKTQALYSRLLSPRLPHRDF